MGLKYIYTGYHKCGTKTIAQAFRILGFKVYDFEENVVHLIHYWKKFFSKKLSTEDRYQLLYNMYKDVDVARLANIAKVLWQFLAHFQEIEEILAHF